MFSKFKVATIFKAYAHLFRNRSTNQLYRSHFCFYTIINIKIFNRFTSVNTRIIISTWIFKSNYTIFFFNINKCSWPFCTISECKITRSYILRTRIGICSRISSCTRSTMNLHTLLIRVIVWSICIPSTLIVINMSNQHAISRHT